MTASEVQQRLHEFSADEYERMGELGLLPDSGVELINGVIVQMSPKGDRHAFVVMQLNFVLTSHAALGYHVYCEALSLRALPDSTPDPDIALARAGRCYANERPRPSEVALIIEVSNSSYVYDTSVKKSIYARAGIAEYWVFDIRDGRNAVRCYARPSGTEYLDIAEANAEDVIAPREFPSVKVDLQAVFGLDDRG